MSHIRLSLLAVLAAVVLALSGCGRSTKTVEVEVPGPIVEVPGPTVEVPVGPPDFVDLSGLPEDAMIMDGSAEIDAGESASIGDVTYSCAAGGVGCTVTVENGAAVSTGAAVTAATSPAYATRKAVAAVTKSAETKEDAIEAEGLQTTDAGLGGTDAPAAGATGAYTLDIDDDGTTVTVTVEGATDDEDVDFMVAEDLMDGRTMQTRTHKADAAGNVMTEVVIVAEDRDEPKPVAFAKFQTADGSTPQTLNVSIDAPTTTFEALGIVAANLGMVKSGTFKAAAGTVGTTILSFQYAVPDDTGTPADESKAAAEIMGTFNGSMGTYKCVATAANCTVTVDGKGVVSAVSNDNDWAFIPAMDVTTDQPDYDYLHYGFG
jgi:hypothetical protein